ncbi:MAG: ribose-phosphate diphosphokinase [Halobacteria archaeon]|nr:ribose-phosphate diphosphokinase [Halobacteria archaeon]
MIVAGSESQALAARVAHESGDDLVEVEYERFPDGESLVRVPGIEDSRAVVVASTPTDETYIELLQTIDACSDAERVDVVMPYMGYARQDKKFEEGEPVTARALGRAVSDGVDSVTTVNVHEPSVLDWFDAETQNLDAVSVLGEKLEDTVESDSPIVLSPDAGAIELAESAQSVLGGEVDYLEKTRISGDEVEIQPKELSVEGREVVIVDDMVATGGTMSTAVELLEEQGAEKVYAACVHPVFARNAVLRLYSAGVEEVVTTDTLKSGLDTVSVASLIADSL